jgi:hypothetical protein
LLAGVTDASEISSRLGRSCSPYKHAHAPLDSSASPQEFYFVSLLIPSTESGRTSFFSGEIREPRAAHPTVEPAVLYHGPGSRHRSLPRVQIYRVMYPLLQWTRGAAEGVQGTVGTGSSNLAYLNFVSLTSRTHYVWAHMSVTQSQEKSGLQSQRIRLRGQCIMNLLQPVSHSLMT